MTRLSKEEIEKAKAEAAGKYKVNTQGGRPPRTDKPTRFNVYVSAELAEGFRKLARDNGRTISGQFEWMVKQALNK